MSLANILPFFARAKHNSVSKFCFKILVIELVAIFILSSCAQQLVNHTPTTNLNKDQLNKLSQLPQQWDIQGRLSIIVNNENWHSRFHWLKQADKFILRFTGPLGQTHLLLEQNIIGQGSNKRIENILTMGQEVYTSTAPIEEFLSSHSGIAIPVTSLQYWIFGHYDPAESYQIVSLSKQKVSSQKEFSNTIKDLFQNGWRIRFSAYQKDAEKVYPAKITARDGEYKIKVFINARDSS